jgi:hypothetical protein
MTSPHDDPQYVRIFQYSEWLDTQGLMRPPTETGDTRTHEDLVLDYLAQAPHMNVLERTVRDYHS